MSSRLAALLVAVALARPALATTDTTNYSDLWWNPSESGWGVTVTQQATTMFLTFFVYSTDGRPTWVTGTLRQTSVSANGQPVFSGPLDATTGTYYGAPWNPSQLTLRTTGAATFTPTTATTATLDYSIDGVPVTKSVQRQTLVFNNLSGSYLVTMSLTITCAGTSPRGSIVSAPVVISQSGSVFQWREFDPNSPSDYCLSTGTADQQGQLTSAVASTTCTPGSRTGTLTLTEITSTPMGLTGHYAFSELRGGVQCLSSGPFTALQP